MTRAESSAAEAATERRNGLLDLPVVDALQLDRARRDALRPGALMRERNGAAHRLPRWFYEVDSWETATRTRLTENFTLHEFMSVDVRELGALRTFPRYVPCAVTLLAAHLELLRREVGTLVWIAANGGYRSPAHALSDHGSAHCWGTAANVYRIGEEYLDTRERIEKYAAIAAEVAPALWSRPYGHDVGEADDHLHLDVGYARLTPRGHDDEAAAAG